MAKAFISYSTKDIRMVSQLTNDLVAKSPVSIFFAPWAIEAGESLVNRIDQALSEADVFVPLLSENFLCSEWAKRELHAATQLAIRREIRLLPVRIGDCEVPPLLSDLKYIDFFANDYDIALARFLSALVPGPDPLRDLASLKGFLVENLLDRDRLISLAKQVLATNWLPEDDKGKGAQFIAQRLENAEDLTGALEVYNATIAIFPRVLPLRMLRSSIHRRLKNFRAANDDCAAILDIDPDNVRALISKFWVNHDWAERDITAEERGSKHDQCRICLERLATIPAAVTTYLHAYLHALAQGAVILKDIALANHAIELLHKNIDKLLERSGKDQEAVLKAFKILEGFYRSCGQPSLAENLARNRARFEEEWGKVI